MAHNDHAPPIEATAIYLATTCHINLITDHPDIEVLQLINPEITVDHTHDHPTNLQGRTHTDQVHIHQIMGKTTPQEEPEGEN